MEHEDTVPIVTDEVMKDFYTHRNFNEEAVNIFTSQMKVKMQIAQLNGKSGWWDKEKFTVTDLRASLMEAIAEQNWVDAANYMMMINIRGEDISVGVY